MKIKLKDAIRDHFESQTLSADQLAKLRNVIEHHSKPHSDDRQREDRTWRLYWLVSAMSLVLIASTLIIWNYKSEDMSELIAREVVQNHVYLKPLDIESGELTEVSEFFSVLGFTPQNSRHVPGLTTRLKGGRYCSVQSVPAAQIRLNTPNHENLDTMYQLKYDPEIFGHLPIVENGESPLQSLVSGVEVEIWVENGLLNVFASDSDAPEE